MVSVVVFVDVEEYLLVDIFLRQEVLPLTLHTLQHYNRLTASFPRQPGYAVELKGKASPDLNEASDDGVLGCSGVSWTKCKQSAPRSDR